MQATRRIGEFCNGVIAMKKLLEGLRRFKNEVVVARRDFFHRLSKSHNPSTLFITCSDSRVSPNLICQTDPGELFVLRNAGNLIPPYRTPGPGITTTGEQATIEYAVDVLGVQDIVLCGHSHCGAMTALAMETPLDGLPCVHAWLDYASDAFRLLEQEHPNLTGKERIQECIRINILVQMNHLRDYPSVHRAIDSGRVRVHGWVYEIETGDVAAYDVAAERFVSLIDG